MTASQVRYIESREVLGAAYGGVGKEWVDSGCVLSASILVLIVDAMKAAVPLAGDQTLTMVSTQ